MATLNESVSQSIALSDSVSLTHVFVVPLLIDNLSFPVPPTNVLAGDYAAWLETNGLRQSVSVQHIANRSLSDTLKLKQNWKTVRENTSQNLTFSQSATGNVQQYLLNNSLTFTSYSVFEVIRNPVLADVLTLTNKLAYYLDTPCVLNPVDSTTFHNGILLTFPYVSPQVTLLLLNPDFGDGEIFEFRRVNRKSRGLTLDIFRDPEWPIAKRLKYSYSALGRKQKDALLQFLDLTLGQQIGLLDYDSRQWVGIITTPASAIKEVIRDSYSITLEFEGNLI